MLENRMIIDYGQQLVLQELAKENAVRAMYGVESNAYKKRKLRVKVFSKVWKDYKEYFEVNSYRNTTKKDFDKAKGLLMYFMSRPDNWEFHEVEIKKHARDGRDGTRLGEKN